MVIKAIYTDGAFKPPEKVPLEQETEVEVYPIAEQGENNGKVKRNSVKDFDVSDRL